MYTCEGGYCVHSCFISFELKLASKLQISQLLWVEMTLFCLKASHKMEKTFINSAETYEILIKKKFLKAYDLVLLFLKKKIFFGVAHAHGVPSHFCTRQVKKWHFSGVLTNFFRTTGLQLKLLILIASPNIFHWKPAEKIKVGVVLGQNVGQTRLNVVKRVKKQILSRFFSYFTCEYLLKQKVVVVHTPEWKLRQI